MSTIPPDVRIAVVGASSLIGEAVVEELRARHVPFSELHLLEDERNVGATVADPDSQQPLPMGDVAAFDFSRVNLVFFCGRAALSERYAEEAARHAWVIDGSSAFRERGDVPLVAADVNPTVLKGVPRGLIALPGSASVALASALAPLCALAQLERVEVASYHAVSGSGRSAVEELAGETVALLSGKQARGRAFGQQIAFNVIAQVDRLDEHGVALEEKRLWSETKRLLGLPDLEVNATTVRVPVFFGHCLAVHATFASTVSVAAAFAAMQRTAGLEVTADSGQIPTPATLAEAPDKVYVGRLRADMTRDRGLNFWLVADNVRKCAAHNAVSVSQILVNRPR
jgi:aspartate-semialdehyde dehydrogenase